MSIFNMVGGGGGSGGGYKTYNQLKAMTLSDAITELNSDAQGYYDNLSGNGHIIGIGIANNDNTTYQCWDVSPIVYWDGAWRNGEIIIVKIKADSSGNLMIPKAGYGIGGSQNASYNWWVSYDGGSETQYSGTGSAGNIMIGSGLTADTEHTVVIRPDSEVYQWARAFGFFSSGVQALLTEIVYDGSYMGYGDSNINTGGYFRYSQYQQCTGLTAASNEVLPNSVTTIGTYFRRHQYLQCTSLTVASNEVLPNSVTTIDTYFRYGQYYGCTSLTAAPDEVLPNGITSIGANFRYSQYQGCTSLTAAPNEVLPNSVTTIGASFRYSQYQGCISLTVASNEVLPNSVTSIGGYFRGYQYQQCTSLKAAPNEVFPNGVTSIGNSFRGYQYQQCTGLTAAPNEVLPNSVTTIGNSFRDSQYRGCTSLTVASNEILPNSVTSIGRYFRRHQYQQCTSLTVASNEVLPNSVTTIDTYFRYSQYYGCTSLTEIKGWIDLNIGNGAYRANQFNSCNSNKIVKVLSNVGYAGQSNTLDNSYVTTILVPSAYLQNFKDSTVYPRSSITDSKFVGY